MLLYTLFMAKNDDFSQLSDLVFDDEEGEVVEEKTQEQLKFDLYLRSRELQQIAAQLERILQKNSRERNNWLKENKRVLESLLKNFVDDSSINLQGLQLDKETAALSMDLAVNLRQTVAMINALFYNLDHLKS